MHLITGKKGEVHVKSENTGFLNSRFCGKGCFVFEHGNNFEALNISDNSIQVRSGQGMMYGRHFEIEDGTTETLNLDTVAVGYVRADLIVVRYEKGSNGIESATLTVIKGEATQGGRPQTPSYNDGDILDGDTLVDFPLYLVYLTSSGISTIEQQFNIVDFDLAQLQSDIESALENVEETLEELSDELELVDLKPNVFYGTSDPFDASSIPAGGENIKIGDLYYKIDGVENKMWYCSTVGKAGQGTVIVNIEWTEIAMKSEVDSKINRNVAIKTFFGSSAPSNVRANYSGLLSGDIYFEGTTSRVGGSIRKVYVAHISDNNEDLVFWRELTTNQSSIWDNYYTKSDADDLLDDKLDRDDGIKVYTDYTGNPPQSYVPSTNVSDWDGIKGGDILYTYYNSGAQNPRDMYIWKIYIASVFNGQMFWTEIAKGDLNNYYTKTETDTLLNAKQDTLTSGNNIVIDANNVIKAKERSWKKVRTIVIDNDNAGQTVDGVEYIGGGSTGIETLGFKFSTDDDGNGWVENCVKGYLIDGTLKTGSSMPEMSTFFTDKNGNRTALTYGVWGSSITSDRSVVNGTSLYPFDVSVSPASGSVLRQKAKVLFDKLIDFEMQFIGGATSKGMADGTTLDIWLYGYWDEEPTRNLAKGTRLEVVEELPTMSKEELEELENREKITLDGTLPDELEGGLLKNIETDVSDTELNEIDDSEVEKDVSEIEKEPETIEK